MTALFIIGIVLCTVGLLAVAVWQIGGEDPDTIMFSGPIACALTFSIVAMAMGLA